MVLVSSQSQLPAVIEILERTTAEILLCFSFHNYHFLHDLPNTLEFMLQQMSNSVAFLIPRSISNKEDTDVKVRQN